MNKAAVLRSVKIFEHLGTSLISELAEKISEAKVKKGETIFSENEVSNSFYIVASGKIKIFKLLGLSKEKTLAEIEPGGVFGEMAFFSNALRTANAAAQEDSLLLKIVRDDFLRFINGKPEAGIKILSELLQMAMERLESTSRELATTFQVSKIISSGKGISSILGSVNEEILAAVPSADESIIYLHNDFNMEFDGYSRSARKIEALTEENELVGTAKKNMSGIIFNKSEKAALFKSCPNSDAKTMIIAPIMKDEKMGGIIVLWSLKEKTFFKESNAALISAIGSQLAEAVENIKHQQEDNDRKRLNESRPIL